MKTNRIKLVVLSATVAAGVSTAFAANAYINQVGYRPSDPKQFSLVGASGNVEIVNASGQTALSVTPGAASYWDASGQNVQLVDFSELKTDDRAANPDDRAANTNDRATNTNDRKSNKVKSETCRNPGTEG